MAESKLYYNGLLLPEMPADFIVDYPYRVVLCWPNGRIQLLGSTSGLYKHYYDASLCTDSSSDFIKAYELRDGAWVEDSSQSLKYTGWTVESNGKSVLHWSNRNISVGYTSSPTIYFYGSGLSTSTTWKCYEITDTTSLTGTLDVEEGMWVLATVTTRSATTYPSDWTLLHESTALNSDNSNQRMAFLCKKAESSGTISFTVTQTEPTRSYLNLVGIKGINGFKYHEGSEYYTNTKYSYYTMKKPSYEKIIWGLSCPTWSTSSPSGDWTCDELTGKPISLVGNVSKRQVNFIDELSGTSRKFTPNAGNDGTACIIDYVEVLSASAEPEEPEIPDEPVEPDRPTEPSEPEETDSIYKHRMYDYYPAVIQSITEFQAIIDGEYPEFDLLYDGTNGIIEDAYLLTMGEKRIEQWEKVLGIRPIEGSSVVDRRDTIIARIRGQGKLNTALINAIVNAFTGGYANSWVEDSVLYVEVTPPPNNKSFKFENVEQELSLKVPAHLGFKVSRNYYDWAEVKRDNATWGDVKNNFETWNEVYIFTPFK